MVDRLEIVQQKWDYLIILDACRYDYFENLYRNYLDGNLIKRISMGSSTIEWRDKSFPDYYEDIIYISANPYFSIDSEVYGYTAGEHFHKVYEIWKTGWDKEKGTVLPETLTKMAIDIISRNRGKRFIIHYLQPHAPYLVLREETRGYDHGDITEFRELKGIGAYRSASMFKKKAYGLLLKLFKSNNLLGNHPDWFLRKILKMPPEKPMEIALRKCDKDGLKKAYKANLEIVLKEVAILLKNISGTIVITSDHGEFLGESRCYSHPAKWTHPILLEVPWLVIEKPGEISSESCNKSQEQPSPQRHKQQEALDQQQQQDQEIIERLRSLGYYE